jgi:cystathionine beta-lyase/cystathionine gamma-synthase
VVYLETPVNPKMELTDRRAIRQVVNRLNEGRAEAEKIRIVVDNTLPRPASGLCSRASTSLCNALRKTSIRSGLQPGGIRLSLGLEDWHDIVADLEDALEVV